MRSNNTVPVLEIFDRRWYESENAALGDGKQRAIVDFLTRGFVEGRSPHPLFDTQWYAQTQMVDAPVGMNPIRHYLTIGAPEGLSPHPLFDPQWYLDRYPDVRDSGLSPIDHYLRVGSMAGRSPHRWFDGAWYLSRYPDVVGSGFSSLEHYITLGWRQGRWPHPEFETEYYLGQDATLQRVGVNPLVHFVLYGEAAGRSAKSKGHVLGQASDNIPPHLDSHLYRHDDIKSVLERNTGQKYKENISEDRGERSPFGQLFSGQLIQQFFQASGTLRSLTIYFYTYMKKNSAEVSIKLSVVDSAGVAYPLFGKTVRGGQVTDGGPVHFILSRPIEHAGRYVFQLDIEIDDLQYDSAITVAGVLKQYKGLTVGLPDTDGRQIAIDFNIAPGLGGKKFFAFVSGCPGDAFRYRCEHQAELLTNLGYSVDVIPPYAQSWQSLLDNYEVVVLHRVAHDEAVEHFLIEAKARGLKVVFDTDDLVFNPARVTEVDAYKRMSEVERVVFLDGLVRYGKTLSLCDFVTVSTNRLAEEVGALWPSKSVSIIRNTLSNAMVEGALQALTEERPATDTVSIAYFSGTKTHQADFEVCSMAIREVLQRHKNARLLVVGHLDVSELSALCPGQVSHHPFVPWTDLPMLYRKVDINIAPLEYDNAFTESKSELKYLEAALLQLPTVASDVGAFSDVVVSGENGLLCRTPSEWLEALDRLVTDASLRRRLGEAAHRHVMATSTTLAAGPAVQPLWRDICQRQLAPFAGKSPRIGFVLRAPIAQTGGGYKKIFILANALRKLFDVKIFVEPIAHLAAMSDTQIQDYVSRNFDFPIDNIVVGHSSIRDIDIAIATNWPTVPVVMDLGNTLVRMYFVQDFEPEFYDVHDPVYQMARSTYEMGLAIITIGDYLKERLLPFGRFIRTVPFAVDQVFRDVGELRALEGAVNDGCSILFFARPGIPRRNFKAGVDGLRELVRTEPKVKIYLYGLEEDIELPFPYVNLGVLDQAELARWMGRVDIHLSFSMTNISTVIYEAMAAGCACVEADVDAVRGMVEDGVNCVLARPDGAGVKSALAKLTSDPVFRRQIAASGQRFASGLTEDAMCVGFTQNLLESWMMSPLSDQEPSTAADRGSRERGLGPIASMAHD